MELPSLSTFGRLLLLLKSIGEASETSSSKRARKKSGYGVGSLVQAEVECDYRSHTYVLIFLYDFDCIGAPELCFCCR